MAANSIFAKLRPEDEEGQSNVLNPLIQRFSEIAMREQKDPVMVAEEQYQKRGFAKNLFQNMMLGAASGLSGNPFKDVRTRLVENEIERATFAQKQRESAINATKTLVTQQQLNERNTEKIAGRQNLEEFKQESISERADLTDKTRRYLGELASETSLENTDKRVAAQKQRDQENRAFRADENKLDREMRRELAAEAVRSRQAVSAMRTRGTDGDIAVLAEASRQDRGVFEQLSGAVKNKVIQQIALEDAVKPEEERFDFGEQPTQGERKEVREINDGFNALTGLLDSFESNPGRLEEFGLAGNAKASKAWQWFSGNTKPAKLKADLDKVKQFIGKALEGGVLRKEDEVKYDRILPVITDKPEVALYKLNQLRMDLRRRIQVRMNTGEASGQAVELYESAEEAIGNSRTFGDTAFRIERVDENSGLEVLVGSDGVERLFVGYTDDGVPLFENEF